MANMDKEQPDHVYIVNAGTSDLIFRVSAVLLSLHKVVLFNIHVVSYKILSLTELQKRRSSRYNSEIIFRISPNKHIL